jgi:hypothetical protein
MMPLSVKNQGVWDGFDRLEALFPSRADEDLSLCFVCLRWTTGDEGCRRGDRCELQLALDRSEAPRAKPE